MKRTKEQVLAVAIKRALLMIVAAIDVYLGVQPTAPSDQP